MPKSLTRTVSSAKIGARISTAQANRTLDAAAAMAARAIRSRDYHRQREELLQAMHDVSTEIDALDNEYKDVK